MKFAILVAYAAAATANLFAGGWSLVDGQMVAGSAFIFAGAVWAATFGFIAHPDY